MKEENGWKKEGKEMNKEERDTKYELEKYKKMRTKNEWEREREK
jgi:hypothetical protein